ncbi:MAG: metal dependent phosphohydrolase [bacterium]|nr:metal dependent phosphohydrolase [bacterium]
MSRSQAHPRAEFTDMTRGTQEDWARIAHEFLPFAAKLPDRVLDHLRLLDGDYGGFIIDRLTHSLQTATRAHRDGRDEEYVVCAVLHDIGDTLGSFNHPDIAAAIVKPFVSPQNHWMVAQHGIFQGYYFFHYLGMDRNARDRFKGDPLYDYTAEFCAKYDAPAFDPAYDTLPLEFFEPMLRRVLSTPKHSTYQALVDKGAPERHG